MINQTEGNWKGKAGFFWAGSCGVMLVWAFFRLPETKVSSHKQYRGIIPPSLSGLLTRVQDRTFEEIDLLFAARTPARKFKGVKVDPYRDGWDKTVSVELQESNV